MSIEHDDTPETTEWRELYLILTGVPGAWSTSAHPLWHRARAPLLERISQLVIEKHQALRENALLRLEIDRLKVGR